MLCALKDRYPGVTFEIRFISGEENVIADALSRRKEKETEGDNKWDLKGMDWKDMADGRVKG